MMVLNRSSLSNLRVEINSDLQLSSSGDYIMYKTSPTVDEVFGLWVFGEDSRDSLLSCLSECVDQAEGLDTQPIADQVYYNEQPAEDVVEESVEERKPARLQTVSLQEIWDALETMAPHSSKILSEQEFQARFNVLVQVPQHLILESLLWTLYVPWLLICKRIDI